MELDFAVLADGVAPRPDGKFDIFGAGVDTIFAPRVPARHARLALLVRLYLSVEEIASEHRLEISLSSSNGTALGQGVIELTPDNFPAPSAITGRFGVGLVVNLDNVVFPDYGNYALSVSWDGSPVREPLSLTVAEPPTGS
jgi:hypothetical protein